MDVEGEHGDGAKDVLNFHQDNHAVQRLVHIVTKGDTEQQIPENRYGMKTTSLYTLDPSYLKKMVKSRLIVKMKTTVCFHSMGSFFHSSVMFG